MLSPPQVLLHQEPPKVATDVFLVWCMLTVVSPKFLLVVRQHMPLHAECQETIIYFVFTIEERCFGPDFQCLYITFLDVAVPWSLTISLCCPLGVREGIPLLAATQIQHWSIAMTWSSSWSQRMVSKIRAWGVRWMGLPHSPKTNGDHLIKDKLIPGGATFFLSLCSFKGLRTVTAQITFD